MPNIVDSFGIIGRVISQQTLHCVQRYPYTQTMDFTQFCSGNWIQYWNKAECSCARCSHSAETACTVYMCVPEIKCQSSLIWTMDCECRTSIYYLHTLSPYKVVDVELMTIDILHMLGYLCVSWFTNHVFLIITRIISAYSLAVQPILRW